MNIFRSSTESDTIAAIQVEKVCVLEQSAELQVERPYAITTLVLMFIAQALIGIANIAFYCLGMSYLDDNLKEHQSPSYIGKLSKIFCFSELQKRSIFYVNSGCALAARIWGQQFGLAIVLAVGAPR